MTDTKQKDLFTPLYQKWDGASIRKSPTRHIEPNELRTHLAFSPSVVAYASHPLIQAETDLRQLLTQELYAHLAGTERLEMKLIVRTAYSIAEKEVDLDLPADARKLARLVIADECWHADFSERAFDEIYAGSGIESTGIIDKNFLQAVDAMAQESTLGSGMVRLVATCVSETLITGTLGKVPRDLSVAESVRALLDDHAKDEAVHHGFFARLLAHIWQVLSERERVEVGCMMPRLIWGFLSPDVPRIKWTLAGLGFSPDEAERIIRESLGTEEHIARVRKEASGTVRHCERIGMLKIEAVRQQFAEAGLLQ